MGGGAFALGFLEAMLVQGLESEGGRRIRVGSSWLSLMLGPDSLSVHKTHLSFGFNPSVSG